MQIEEAEKQQKINEEEVAAYTRRCVLTEDDLTRSEARLSSKLQHKWQYVFLVRMILTEDDLTRSEARLLSKSPLTSDDAS